MKKDNLVFGMAGIIVGIVLGVLLASQAIRKDQTIAAAVQQTAPQHMEQQQLPEGHPPVNQELVTKIAEQEKILASDPENQSAIVALANLNYDLNNHEVAVKWYERALQKDPQNINLITDLATSYLQLQNVDKSLELFNKSLTINPKHFQSLMNLGIARMSIGDKEGAAKAWEKLIAYYPDDPNLGTIKDALQKMKAKG